MSPDSKKPTCIHKGFDIVCEVNVDILALFAFLALFALRKSQADEPHRTMFARFRIQWWKSLRINMCQSNMRIPFQHTCENGYDFANLASASY
ncbi:hypothetical protein ALC57_02155 [Trachymyrmex cornetzi]|uniref:Uncharacterized protein n=1 Tax=Trachymyrmex cornetzi TaxID=471704 RepID=A0A195EJJ9_9HYME|nr:hypothetical protein ALC57_02155 [Trachymyrmex cornetzi]